MRGRSIVRGGSLHPPGSASPGAGRCRGGSRSCPGAGLGAVTGWGSPRLFGARVPSGVRALSRAEDLFSHVALELPKAPVLAVCGCTCERWVLGTSSGGMGGNPKPGGSAGVGRGSVPRFPHAHPAGMTSSPSPPGCRRWRQAERQEQEVEGDPPVPAHQPVRRAAEGPG